MSTKRRAESKKRAGSTFALRPATGVLRVDVGGDPVELLRRRASAAGIELGPREAEAAVERIRKDIERAQADGHKRVDAAIERELWRVFAVAH